MKRLDTLTGIRALAALWVLLGHFWSFSTDYLHFAVPNFVNQVMSNAWLGVDLFFVLSGFIISYTYWNSLSDPEVKLVPNIRRFYFKRFARIFPVYLMTTLIALFFYVLAGILGHKFNHESGLIVNPFGVVANLLGLQEWFSLGSFNGPSWSVSAEIFAYMTFPLLFIARRYRSSNHGIGYWPFITFVFGVVWLQVIYPGFISPRIVQVTIEFALGILVFVLRNTRISKVIDNVNRKIFRATGWALVLCALFLSTWTATEQHFAAVGFALVIYAESHPLAENKFLSSRPMVRLGLWSYSLYLVHRLVQNIVSGAGGLPSLGLGEFQKWVIWILLVSVPVALSALTYRFIEEPSRTWISSRLLRKNK